MKTRTCVTTIVSVIMGAFAFTAMCHYLAACDANFHQTPAPRFILSNCKD